MLSIMIEQMTQLYIYSVILLCVQATCVSYIWWSIYRIIEARENVTKSEICILFGETQASGKSLITNVYSLFTLS